MIDKVDLKFDRYKKGAVAPKGDEYAASFLENRAYDTVQLVFYEDMKGLPGRISAIVNSGDATKKRFEDLRALTRKRFENSRPDDFKGERLQPYELRNLEGAFYGSEETTTTVGYAFFVDEWGIAKPADEFSSALLKERDSDTVQFAELATYERTIDEAIAKLEAEKGEEQKRGTGSFGMQVVVPFVAKSN